MLLYLFGQHAVLRCPELEAGEQRQAPNRGRPREGSGNYWPRLRGQHVQRNLPKTRGRVGIQRVGGHATATSWPVGLGLVAVLEVTAADAVEQRGRGQQHGGGCALLGRLPLEVSRLIHPRLHPIKFYLIEMAL